MRPLIKSSAAGGLAAAIRPFAVRPVESADMPSAESLLQARIAELELELDRRNEELPSVIEKARADGASEALRERSEAEGQALEAVRVMLSEAKKDWSARLQSWEGAASGIAREVLARVFGASEERSLLVEAAIRQRLELLDSESIVRVRVSAADFSSEQELAAAAARIGTGVELAIDAGLDGGQCAVDLKLGHVDVGIGSQWARISALLDTVEAEGGSR